MRWSYGLCIIAILAFACATAWAQGTAQISGSVADPTGALLPGAEVTATQTATGQTRTVITNESGFYVLPSLPTGPYRLEVSLPGFRTFAQTGVVLEVNANTVINASLEVGQVTQTVEVQANAALVETRNIGVGQLMETQRILELPLNGRNVTELITLSGAATAPPDGSSVRSVSGQANIRVAGGLSGSVHYSLDGANHTNPFDNLSLPLPFPDALQEFKVETSALSAAAGGSAGAQASAVTKSGTNDFHGSLFEFVRNDLFNARQYFARTNSTLKRNQFGGTAGGPIIKNKLFFFGGYQGTTIRQDPADSQAYVPTAAMLAGDFTKVASSACGQAITIRTTDAVTGSPTGFANNRIDPALFNPVALNLTNRLPKPLDDCGLVIYGFRDIRNEGQWVGRGDWQITPNHSIIGRTLITTLRKPAPYSFTPDNILTTSQSARSETTQSYTVGDTWLISPSTVASIRLTANYTGIHRLGAEFFNMAEMGVKNFYAGHLPKFAHTTVAGTNGFTLGQNTQNSADLNTFSSSVNTDVSLTRGTHQISVGGVMFFWDSNSLTNVFSPGIFTFSGARTGMAMADFLTGRLATFRQASPNFNRVKKYSPSLYITDSWKTTRKLTLSYGLRWEPEVPEIHKEGSVQNFSEERRRAGIRSTVYKNAPLGFYYPGDPGYPGKRGRDINWWTFAPRLGFAYDVGGDGKTSVRGSAGLGYDALNIQAHLWTAISPPFNYDVTVNNSMYDDPWAPQPGGNPFPATYGTNASFTAFGGYTTMPYHLDSSKALSWNLSLQRQVGQDLVVSASYLGNHVVHMLTTAPLNPAIYFPGNANSAGECVAQGYTFRTTPGAVCSTTANTNLRRILSLVDFQNTGRFVAAVAEYQSSGKVSYNGMLLDVRKRARNLTLSANYTWSHCLGSDQDTLNGNLYDSLNTYIYVGDRDRGITNCTSDRRHIVNMTGVARTPRFANKQLRWLASDWQLAPIYRISTGPWLSVTTGANTDPARNGTAPSAQPADQILSSPYGDTSGRPDTAWLNRAAFAVPTIGTFGNMKPRTVRGPKNWSFDVALSRSFNITEGQRMEFRVEAYNVTNSFRPGNPDTAINNQMFGVIRTALDPRILQFALKYAF
jgi:hypothetical protein